MALREYHKRWEFDLKSSPERLWPFIADTNRFNRDTGVPQIEVGPADKQLRNARRKVLAQPTGVAARPWRSAGATTAAFVRRSLDDQLLGKS